MARILLVEDEARIATYVSNALRAKAIVVDCIGSGPSVAARVVNDNYCLVLLDIDGPDQGGLVLRDIMAEKPSQKVMVLSVHAGVDRKVRCLEIGAIDYVCKPFSVDELMARIQGALRDRQPDTARPVVRRGTLTIDLARRTANAGNGDVRLTQREFVLLNLLMSEEGSVLSREKLLAEVWGYPYDPGSNVLDVTIHRLRNKIGEGLIETVRNEGYSLRTLVRSSA